MALEVVVPPIPLARRPQQTAMLALASSEAMIDVISSASPSAQVAESDQRRPDGRTLRDDRLRSGRSGYQFVDDLSASIQTSGTPM